MLYRLFSVCDSPGGALITLNFFELTTKHVSARSHYAGVCSYTETAL